MLTPDLRPRFTELLDRLVQPGPKASHVSASEIHEVVDLAHEALATIHALELDAMTDAEVDQEIRDAGGDPEEIVKRGRQMVDRLLAERRAATGVAVKAVPERPAQRQVWIWRAWSADRDRICDCGTAAATTEAEATAIAWRCLGGPWAHLVVHVDVESVTDFYLPPEAQHT